jgi:hypothetical protein
MSRFPGKWTVRAEQEFGFEISRALGGWQSEWLKDANGDDLVFDTQAEAQLACDRANGEVFA